MSPPFIDGAADHRGLHSFPTRRSSDLVPTRRAAAKLSDEELIAQLITLRGVGRWTVEMLLMHTLGRPDILPVDDFGVDRKSTRLNSSHPSISYAVFCLKKKKTYLALSA